MVALAMAAGATEEGRRPWTTAQLEAAEEVMELLVSWPRFMLTFKGPVKPFSEGGSIQKRQLRTEAAFCGPVADYARIDAAVSRAPGMGETILRLRWQAGLTQKVIADRIRWDQHVVRSVLWGATAGVLRDLTGIPDPDNWLRIWRERAHNEKRDHA